VISIEEARRSLAGLLDIMSDGAMDVANALSGLAAKVDPDPPIPLTVILERSAALRDTLARGGY
jgi:hypothetical protein